ncbi:Ribosomal protein L37, mitochondrial [Moelleriella libera RCEF 2490]|uniref:Large ribosomal subunit protein mL54 n=1 Tax=Moelleriella libera RCEF 2490 TaxID=1081109 RepID=A0A168ES13_9HYPO|nr:Ribosomal protein L37, mitochondrial [Moelleriella libera RCEF 2490]
MRRFALLGASWERSCKSVVDSPAPAPTSRSPIPPPPPRGSPSKLPDFDHQRSKAQHRLGQKSVRRTAAMLCTRCIRFSAVKQKLPALRQISSTAHLRHAEPPQLSTPNTDAPSPPPPPPPQDSTSPLTPAAAAAAATTPRSICLEGTVLTGLNYTKNGKDPVAKKDEEYPEWLWSCLDVMKKADAADESAGDEFSKSKKQRKLAAKRQKALEAKLLAEGNLEALAPKVPIQKQAANLPGEEGGSLLDNIRAAEKRQELKKAMRKERKAKIKEANYLKSM